MAYTAAAMVVLLLWTEAVVGQEIDTVHTLEAVEVSSQRPPATLLTAAPTQVVDAEKIERMGALQLSDAVKQMAGITLKDYGGIGGMKTVSARGLGSQFSTLTIDGVAVDNSQNGQVDLGRYLIGNAAYVSLSQGQGEEALLSARAYAAGNVISLESAEPIFFMAERDNFRVGCDAGSFGLLSPTGLWEHKWSRKLSSSLWIGYIKSDGDYPFTLYYTPSHDGLSTRQRRLHSAMNMLTADAAFFYSLTKRGHLTLRLHHNSGMHQLPGDVVHYRNEPSAQSSTERQDFVQAKWRLIRQRWKVQLLGKMQTSFDSFEDSAALGYADRYMENHYQQHEGYLSASAVWQATEWADISAAADGSLVSLSSNLPYRNQVSRTNLASVLAAHLHGGAFEGRANLLLINVADRVVDLDTMPLYQRLSPYASLMWHPLKGLTVRYFYKENYRVPTFSELYMFYSIPKKLRPERAHQHNLGITYVCQWLSVTADAYYNRVLDKIIALPGQNMFYWSMSNIGLVRVLGVDLTADATAGPVTLHLNYSLAKATDQSNPTDAKTFGHQIAYTPRHSGGFSARWENRLLNLSAQAMVVGVRYSTTQNSAANRLPAYSDIAISADRSFNLRWGTIKVKAQVLNLFDVQYEVVKDYPMMGRNFRIGFNYEW